MTQRVLSVPIWPRGSGTNPELCSVAASHTAGGAGSEGGGIQNRPDASTEGWFFGANDGAVPWAGERGTYVSTDRDVVGSGVL